MNRSLFVYNPKSGPGGVAGKLDYIIGRFSDKNILLQPYRMKEGDNDMLLKLMQEDTFSSITVSGGDGSVNSVVNLMMHNGIDLPLGIIPGGTCNDFARSLNIPSEIKASVDIILAGHTEEVDVGLINDSKYFLSTCAGGSLVDVSFNTSNDLKRSFGPLAYYFKALSEFPSIKPVKLRIETDDEKIEHDFLFFLIVNGKHAAGFNNIISDAEISDGYMDILLLGNCLHIDLPALFFKVLNNDLINDSRVMWLRTQNCIIEGNSDLPVSIDGEQGCGLPMSVKFLKKALKVYIK